jgi:tetratricopeptide (TPR) repeat protein
MAYTVERFGNDFLIVSGGLPFRTPKGTPVVSACPHLLTEVATDLQRHGSDPTKQFSMYSLQASHLDFTLRRPREALVAGLAEDAPRDLWFNRPAFPPMQLAMDELWGPCSLAALHTFPSVLRDLSPRQLTAVTVARANLNSAQLGVEAAASTRSLVSLAMGACEQFFEKLISARASQAPNITNLRDESAWRRPPTGVEEACCAACMSDAGVADAERASHCEIHGLLQLLRRFAAFPEEPSQRNVELLEFVGKSNRLAGSSVPRQRRDHDRCECEIHFDQATEHAKAGDLIEAIAEYRAATELCYDNAAAWLYLGNCLFNTGRHAEFLEALDRALTLVPESAIAWESKANVLNDIDRDEEAFECYVRALERDSTRIRSRCELARMMIDQHRFAEAVELADGVLEQEPTHWYAHAKRALALDCMGDLQGAQESYRTAIRENPESAQIINNYGTLLEKVGDRDAAVAMYRRALAVDPSNTLAMENLRRLGLGE